MKPSIQPPKSNQATRDEDKTQRAFLKSHALVNDYSRQLRKIGREVGRIISAFPPGDPKALAPIKESLSAYAKIVEPWAKATAEKMVAAVAAQNALAWRKHTKSMSLAMRATIAQAPVGIAARERVAEQVGLITSLPIEAAERVQHLTFEALADGNRSAEIKKEIMRSGEVTESRATLIARTEVSRTGSALTQSRAEYIGSPGYIWRTAHDGDVRESHRQMEGQFVRWDSPPTLDNMTGHAGEFPNCRCYAEPVVPDKIT